MKLSMIKNSHCALLVCVTHIFIVLHGTFGKGDSGECVISPLAKSRANFTIGLTFENTTRSS